MKLNNIKWITSSGEETQEIGEKIAKNLKKGDFISLLGELGSGKTTFVQGLAKGLGIKKRIISPTFIISRTYKLSNFEFINFCHVDLYRIEGNKREIFSLGLDEIINDGKSIIVVEWAEKMKKLLPKKRWEIRFKNLGESKREIIIRNKQ